MYLFKKHLAITAFWVINLFFCSSLFAANIYVDNTLSSNCTAGDYSVADKRCGGSDGDAYITIQSAINSSSVGDVIYMRGGTYNEIAIDIPESKNGTAWTEGNYTTLRSYPGEWAVVDGTGLNTSSHWSDQAVFTHPANYNTGTTRDYNEYWVFSNFEVTGGLNGFFLKVRHVKWLYMYIHDNNRRSGDGIMGGIVSACPQYAEIKYSYFKDNEDGSGNNNNSNILFDSDYKDTSGNGEAFNPDAATHHNEVAYNYLEGSRIGLRQKNQQRFGYNNRDPKDREFKEFGDKWHHNIILGAHEAIGASQDYIQIYNNITDSHINIGRTQDVPIIYNAAVYNNTVKQVGYTFGAYTSGAGYSTSRLNYYDDLPQRTVHAHHWFYNNIAGGNTNSSNEDVPFIFNWQSMPENTTNPDQDNSDLVIERNLIHNSTNRTADFTIGHNYSSSFSGCDLQYKTIAEFNACSATWRSVDSVINWKNTTPGLFVADSGPQQYVTNWDFKLDDATILCDGGRGGSHPYLDGELLPGYVGATNPNDNSWVSGVLLSVASIDWLKEQGAAAPAWVEKSVSSSGPCKAPPKPPAVTGN